MNYSNEEIQALIENSNVQPIRIVAELKTRLFSYTNEEYRTLIERGN